MHKVEQELYSVKVKKRVLVATVELQAEENETLQADRDSLHRSIVDQEARGGTDKICCRTGDIYSGLSFNPFLWPV